MTMVRHSLDCYPKRHETLKDNLWTIKWVAKRFNRELKPNKWYRFGPASQHNYTWRATRSTPNDLRRVVSKYKPVKAI